MLTIDQHIAAAERLLASAEEVEPTPRCHLAKTYASMASAHVAMADLKHRLEAAAGRAEPVEHLREVTS